MRLKEKKKDILCPQGDHSLVKKTDAKILIIRKCGEHLDWKYLPHVIEHVEGIFLTPFGGEDMF